MSLRISWGPCVTGVEVLNDLAVAILPDGAQVELGSFFAARPGGWSSRSRSRASRRSAWCRSRPSTSPTVALPQLVMHTTSVPMHVNVVPGDQAAGRIPDPKVRSEALFQRTQRDKREAGRLLSEGRTGEASELLWSTGAQLRTDAALLPSSMAGDLFGEADLMDSLADEAGVDNARAAKMMSYDTTSKSRFRGRQVRGGRVRLRCLDGADELVLEPWAAQRLVRGLPETLSRLLRPSTGPRDQASAQAMADALGADHPAHGFFTAAARGGFLVERA